MATPGFRIVPFYSRQEWESVYQNLFSRDPEDQAVALRIIARGRCRLYSRMPRAMEASAALVAAQLEDTQARSLGQANKSIERLICLYSTALVRFVGDILEPVRKKEQISTKEAGIKLGVPDWIVDLRNTFAHATSLHSLEVLRSASSVLLLWLRVHYWEKERHHLDKQAPPSAAPTRCVLSASGPEPDAERICSMLEDFRDTASKRKCGRQKMATIREKCAALLADIAAEVERDSDLVVELLLTKNFLLPDEESLATLCPGVELEPYSLNEDEPFAVPPALRRTWSPVLTTLGSQVQLLAEGLVLVQDPAQLFLAMAWIEHLLTSTPRRGASTLFHKAGEDCVQQVPLRAHLNVDVLLRLAMEHTHKFSVKLVSMLADELPMGLDQYKRRQLLSLVAIETMNVAESSSEDGTLMSNDDDRYTVEDFQGCGKTSKEKPFQASEDAWTLPLRSMPWESTPIGAVPDGLSLHLDFTELRPLGDAFPAVDSQRPSVHDMEAFNEDRQESESQGEQRLLDIVSRNVQLFGV